MMAMLVRVMAPQTQSDLALRSDDFFQYLKIGTGRQRLVVRIAKLDLWAAHREKFIHHHP